MTRLITTRAFTRAFSQLRKTPEFQLIKFDARSESDYQLFRDLIIENIQFSALQFFIPDLKQEVRDLGDKEEVRQYFDKSFRDTYLRNAYNYVTQNQDLTPLGYKKVMRQGAFVGNSGWMVQDITPDGVIHKLERGIHLRQDLCCPNPSAVEKPRLGAMIMRQVVQDLVDNEEILDPRGAIVSSILKTNERSQAFTQKYKLNVGRPFSDDGGVVRWVDTVRNFTSRAPEILGLLDEAITIR